MRPIMPDFGLTADGFGCTSRSHSFVFIFLYFDILSDFLFVYLIVPYPIRSVQYPAVTV